MFLDTIKEQLNTEQFTAVTTDSQYVRIIAGAGSGKTRVLTYRISYLLTEKRVAPWKILAITFTNKVANEMKERVQKLSPDNNKLLSIRTFHSFAANFLRMEINRLNFPSTFTILDEEDQLKIVKDIASKEGYRKTDPIVKKTIKYIGDNKLHGKYPDDIKIGFERFPDEKVCLSFYELYEEIKSSQYALDFDDLLLQTNRILESFPDVRYKWQEKIDHILIDEFQDTNDVEYKMIKLLLKPTSNLYVVGDPDQTIYTWRGANQKIIMDLMKNYPGIETIVLNRNYRSTQNILDSANHLISNNKYRIKKDLFTKNEKGQPIVVNHSFSSKLEGEYVAREISKLKHSFGYSYSDIAILYRSNFVSLDFETALSAHQIPFVMYGGTKFYQRKEIKDVLSFFRLVNNKKDDLAFERIINIPRRGIGENTINIIKNEASSRKNSIFEYIESEDSLLSLAPKKAINALKSLTTLLSLCKEEIDKQEEVISKTLENMIQSVGYYQYLSSEEDEERLENVKALFSDLRNYLHSNPDSTFEEYLQNIALVSAQDEIKDGEHVYLMTAHTAKGLEFPIVFIVRLNNGVFPHNRALNENGYTALEEERRLAYVAMTRAKQRLYLSYCDGYFYGAGVDLTVSQFICESGNSGKSYSPFEQGSSNFSNKKSNKDSSFDRDFSQEPIDLDDPFVHNISQIANEIQWEVGDIVIHQTFGEGVVTKLEGDGIIEVLFKEHGKKSLLGNHKYLKKGNK